MSSTKNYSQEVRLALREGKGEINDRNRKYLDLLAKDLQLSAREVAVLEDESVQAFRSYKAELEEILKAEYPTVSDVSVKRLSQIQERFDLSNEDIEGITDLCLAAIESSTSNRDTTKALRDHLLLVGGTIVVGGAVVAALPALSVGVAGAVAVGAIQSFNAYQQMKKNDKQMDGEKAKLKVKKKFFDTGNQK
jgi:hypothetical protein